MITIKSLIKELQQFPEDSIIVPYSDSYSDNRVLFICDNASLNSKVIAAIENNADIKDNTEEYYIIKHT